ncbi:MAG: hypothetical protein EPN25_11900 [Nitrospirae bacterium]|nr:MAG: hypothetical protein EPN25_11900 [Nitrospirota bacterium]
MKLPEYVTREEVKRVCKELKLSDWTKLKDPKVSLKEAKVILKQIDTGGLKIDPEQFRAGLEVELEHGTRFRDANITNNHPVLTGMIVLAHMHETLDYYMRLDIAEIEGDLHKAVVSKNLVKINKYYRKLLVARIELALAEAKEL